MWKANPQALALAELQNLQPLCDVALKKTLEKKADFENELGGPYKLSKQNALFENALATRLKELSNMHDWLRERTLERTTATAKLYDLAEFRRFRNRVVQKGASP